MSTGRYVALRSAAAMTPARRRRLLLAALLGSFAIVCSIGLLATSGFLIVRAAEMPAVLQLTVAIVAVRFFGTFRAAARYGERLTSHDLAFRQLADLRRSFFEALRPLVPASLPGLRGGDILSRFVADVDTLQDLYLRVLLPPLIAVLAVVAAVVTAALVLPAAAVVLLCALLAGGTVVPVVSAAVAGSAGRRQAVERARLSIELLEALDGAAELAVLGRAHERVTMLGAADARLAALARRDAVAGGLAVTLGSMVSGVALVGVLAVALPAVQSGRISGPLLGLLALLTLAAFEAVTELPAAARRLSACSAAAERLAEIERHPVLVADPARPVALAAATEVALRVRGVTVYGDSVAGSGRPLLSGVDLDLEAGRAVALVGASGAGKTTLAHLMVRFADPAAGTISYGGVDLRALEQDELRRRVLLCAQDAHLFNTSIAENLRLARTDAGDDELIAALRAVGLGPFVAALPDGLGTLVGQNGAELSGGQRRRLITARGLVATAPVVIFDEPAAHLDPAGAEALHQRLCDERENGRAVLVIAHALNGLDRFDEIIVLDQGRVVERGDHSALLAAGGRYARLALDQAAALAAAEHF